VDSDGFGRHLSHADHATLAGIYNFVLDLFARLLQIALVHFQEHSMNGVEAGYTRLIIHDDEDTPRDFVTGLLRAVFSQSASDAIELMGRSRPGARRSVERIRVPSLRRCCKLHKNASRRRGIGWQ